MRLPIRATVCLLLAALALTSHRAAAQNLVTDGTFMNVTYSGTTTGVTTPYFGQLGPDGTGTPASGATLSLYNATTNIGWTTNGYNFLYTAASADANGTTGALNETPGQFTNGSGYGSTFLWGAKNSGLSTITNSPAGGNFIAADGAYETAAIVQAITGLVPNANYAVSFYWAGAQQQGFTGVTTDQWRVGLGTSALTSTSPASAYQATPVVTTPSHSFTGWMSQTVYFTATQSSELLSFLAVGTPSGEPPFAALSGVTMTPVPEPSTRAWFAGLGAAGVLLLGIRRRQRRLAACRADGARA